MADAQHYMEVHQGGTSPAGDISPRTRVSCAHLVLPETYPAGGVSYDFSGQFSHIGSFSVAVEDLGVLNKFRALTTQRNTPSEGHMVVHLYQALGTLITELPAGELLTGMTLSAIIVGEPVV